MKTSLVVVQVLVVVVGEQQLFLQQQLEFLQEFKVVEDVDVDNVVFDNVLVDDDHIVCDLLVDIHFKFVNQQIVDLDNDFVFVDNLVVCFVDIFVVVVVIDQFVVDLVDLVDYNFVVCYDNFFVEIHLVDILVVVLVLVVVDYNIDFDDVFDNILVVDHIVVVDFAHIVEFVHIVVVVELDIVVVEQIVVDKLVAVVVGHNNLQDIIVVVVECIELQRCNSCNTLSKIIRI